MATRTCCVCGGTAEKTELLRFVGRVDGLGSLRLTLDLEQICVGGGVYCHPTRECLKARDLSQRLGRSVRKRLVGGSGVFLDVDWLALKLHSERFFDAGLGRSWQVVMAEKLVVALDNVAADRNCRVRE